MRFAVGRHRVTSRAVPNLQAAPDDPRSARHGRRSRPRGLHQEPCAVRGKVESQDFTGDGSCAGKDAVMNGMSIIPGAPTPPLLLR